MPKLSIFLVPDQKGFSGVETISQLQEICLTEQQCRQCKHEARVNILDKQLLYFLFEVVFLLNKTLRCLPFSKNILFLILIVFGCIILFWDVFHYKFFFRSSVFKKNVRSSSIIKILRSTSIFLLVGLE